MSLNEIIRGGNSEKITLKLRPNSEKLCKEWREALSCQDGSSVYTLRRKRARLVQRSKRRQLWLEPGKQRGEKEGWTGEEENEGGRCLVSWQPQCDRCPSLYLGSGNSMGEPASRLLPGWVGEKASRVTHSHLCLSHIQLRRGYWWGGYLRFLSQRQETSEHLCVLIGLWMVQGERVMVEKQGWGPRDKWKTEYEERQR